MPSVHLLPNYDEYFIAYRDRSPTAALPPPNAPVDPMDSYAHLLCVEGRFGGFWRRTVGSRAVAVQLLPYRHFEPRAPGRGQGGGWTLRRVPRPAAGVQRAAGEAVDVVKPQRAISA